MILLTQEPTPPDISTLERELQTTLNPIGIQVQIHSQPDHLDIQLIRSHGTKISYSQWVRQIQTALRASPHIHVNTLTIYGQVQGQRQPEWTLTARVDEDDLINQVLKQDLALLQVKTLVRRKQDHLHILLTRPEDLTVNYSAVMRLIREDLRMLRPSGISGITVYGRIQEQSGFEWQVTSRLEEEDERDREGTTLHLPTRCPSQPPIPIQTCTRSPQIRSRWLAAGVGLCVFLLVGLLALQL